MGVILFSGTILHNPPQLSRFKLLSDNLSDDSETNSHVQSPLSEAINMILHCQSIWLSRSLFLLFIIVYNKCEVVQLVIAVSV